MRILVTGASGFVGSALADGLRARGHDVVPSSRAAAAGARGVDLAAPGAVARLVEVTAPQAVVHCAALADIAPCEADPRAARRLNGEVPGELAAACAARGTRLLHVSTDQIFDGRRGGWREEDEAAPLHEYGRSKLLGERAVAAVAPAAIVVRLGLVTGPAPAGRRSASSALREALARGARPRLFTDELRTPVASVDVARALAELLERDELWTPDPLPGAPGRCLHLGGPERLSRLELGRREAAAAGFEPDRCEAGTRAAAGMADSRPADLSLDSRRIVALAGWVPRTLAQG